MESDGRVRSPESRPAESFERQSASETAAGARVPSGASQTHAAACFLHGNLAPRDGPPRRPPVGPFFDQSFRRSPSRQLRERGGECRLPERRVPAGDLAGVAGPHHGLSATDLWLIGGARVPPVRPTSAICFPRRSAS